MKSKNIQIPAIISTVIFLLGALFQLLLFSGIPLGEYSWGGKHKGVLPQRLRLASLLSAVLLLFMGFVLLMYAKVLFANWNFSAAHLVVWVITIFMGLNTLGNLASKSKKEKLWMTPQTSIAFLTCLLVSIYRH